MFLGVTKIVFSLSSRVIFIWFVPWKVIHKGIYGIECNVVDQNIYIRNTKVIFRASSIQISKVHADFDLPLFFWYDNYVTYCGYLTTSKKLVFHYFSISSLTLIKTFGWVFLNFCLTSLHPSTSDTLCTIIFVSKSDISL